jgi:hypothetical protein
VPVSSTTSGISSIFGSIFVIEMSLEDISKTVSKDSISIDFHFLFFLKTESSSNYFL